MPSLRAERDGPTVVSAGMHISGNLISDCDVQIDGCVEGDVQSPRLVITEQGSVLGSVYAEEVDIRGAVNGHVMARSVTLRQSARVALDITYGKVSVESGAQIEGRLMPVPPGDRLLTLPVLRPPTPPPAARARPGAAPARTEIAAPPPRPARAGGAPEAPALERSAVYWPPPDPYATETRGSAPKLALGPEHLPEALLAPAFEVDAEPDFRPADQGAPPPGAGAPQGRAGEPDRQPLGGGSPIIPPSSRGPGSPGWAPERARLRRSGARERREETFIGLEAEAEAALERDPEPLRFPWKPAPPPDAGRPDVFEARPADILAAAHRPTVAVPITLQARDVAPRRRYGMSLAVAALVVVAAAGAYLGARELEGETLTAMAPAADEETAAGVAPVADSVDARIQAEIERRRREMEQAGLLPGRRAGPGRPAEAQAGIAAAPAAEDTAAAAPQRPEEAAGAGALAAVQPAAGAGQGEAQAAARPPAEVPEGAAAPEDEDAAGGAASAPAEADEADEAEEAADAEPAERAPVDGGAESGDLAAVKPELRPTQAAMDHFTAGMEAAEHDDFVEAVAHLSPAIESGRLADANLAAAYRNRARAYAGIGDYEEALADYTRTIELMSGDAVAYNNRGYVYNKLDRPRDALPDITRAIELDPDYSFAYSNRCWTYRKLGQRDKAIADCRRALALNPRLEFARSTLTRLGVAP